MYEKEIQPSKQEAALISVFNRIISQNDSMLEIISEIKRKMNSILKYSVPSEPLKVENNKSNECAIDDFNVQVERMKVNEGLLRELLDHINQIV